MWCWWLVVAFAEPVTPDDAVLAGLSQDPGVASAEAAVTGAEGATSQGARPRSNPTVNVQLGFGVQQHQIALTQPLSVTGEGLATLSGDRHALASATAAVTRARLEAAAQIRQLYVAAVVADADLALSQEALALATVVREATEGRHGLGEAGALELHMARLQEGVATEDWFRAARAAASARAELAARTGLAQDCELVADPMRAVPADAEGGGRSDVLAATEAAEAARARVRAARAAVFAPVELGVWAQAQNLGSGVQPGGGLDLPAWDWQENVGWSVGPSLSVQLPVWSQNAQARAVAAGEARAAEVAAAAVRARSEAERRAAEAGQALTDEAARRTAGALDADADGALAAVDAAVQAGELGALEASQLRAQVLDARRRITALRASLASARIEAALALEWPTLLGGG